MFQFRPQFSGTIIYNSFVNPYYSVHRDMAYAGTTLIAAVLKYLSVNKEQFNLTESDMERLCEAVGTIITKKSLEDIDINKALEDTNYFLLEDKIKTSFELMMGRFTLNFIFYSIKEANMKDPKSALATYEEAWKNLQIMEVDNEQKRRKYKKLKFYYKIKEWVKNLFNKLSKNKSVLRSNCIT